MENRSKQRKEDKSMENRSRIIWGRFLVIVLILTLWSFSTKNAAFAAEPLKIGFITSLSGAYAAVGLDMKDGFILYIDEIKRKAGGRDIEVIVEDGGTGQVDKSLEKARKLIQKDRIEILAGIIDSGSAYALINVVKQNKLPFVIANAGADDLTQRQASPFVIRPAFVDSAGSHPFGVWAFEKGFRKAVVLGADYAAGYEHVGGFCRTFTKAGGEIIQEIWPPLGNPDFGPYLASIKRDADVVMVFFAGADALRFVKQYAEYGLKGKIPLISKGYLVDENILPQQGEAAEGIITESHWCYLLENPENKAFNTAFREKFKRATTSYAEQGYVSAKVITEALKATKGQVKGEEFVKVMRDLKIQAPRGVVKFDGFGGTIQTSYIRKVEKVKGEWQNVPFASYPEASQFWTWSSEEFMKMPTYISLKGKWGK